MAESWDGTLSSSEFYVAACAFVEQWRKFNSSLPQWSWVPSTKRPWNFNDYQVKDFLYSQTSSTYSRRSVDFIFFHVILIMILVLLLIFLRLDICPWNMYHFPRYLRCVSFLSTNFYSMRRMNKILKK